MEPDVLRQARRLELTARRLVDSHALGAYESIFRGHGVEFAEVRAYEPGDSFQAIDWKVTARMRRPYVKRFVEERELTVLLAVDLSGSTGFGTRGRLKRELALELCAVLCVAAMRSQDRVGTLLFTDRVERYVRPVRGRNRTLRLLHEVLSHRTAGRGTDIPRALDVASRLLAVRSLVFVLSDFLLPAGTARAELDRALRGLARRHDVVAVELRDPAEESLPAAGLLETEDPETGERRILDLADAGEREALETAFAARRERLRESLRAAGADHLEVRTDRPYAADLRAFFAARARGRRRLAGGRPSRGAPGRGG